MYELILALWLRRSSFDTTASGSKRKCQNEGEDADEDVEEQRVSRTDLRPDKSGCNL